jgi:hypothetical protein
MSNNDGVLRVQNKTFPMDIGWLAILKDLVLSLVMYCVGPVFRTIYSPVRDKDCLPKTIFVSGAL